MRHDAEREKGMLIRASKSEMPDGIEEIVRGTHGCYSKMSQNN